MPAWTASLTKDEASEMSRRVRVLAQKLDDHCDMMFEVLDAPQLSVEEVRSALLDIMMHTDGLRKELVAQIDPDPLSPVHAHEPNDPPE